jgi:hypothetical protein
MMEPLLVSEQNIRSHRWAVVADEGASVWLYLTESNGQRPVADCWLLNTVHAPKNLEAYSASKAPPPATRQYVDANAQAAAPRETAVRFQWSEDGESVAVFIKDEIFGFIAAGQKRGFSRHLVAEGPFGCPFDERLYGRLFKP